jgi:hypothetical protein
VTRDTVAPRAVAWHDGPRAALRHLFELADDAAKQIDSYIELGRVLVALDGTGAIMGHAHLVATDRTDTIERDAFTEANGYPRGLEVDGIPVRDSITFTQLLDASEPAH